MTFKWPGPFLVGVLAALTVEVTINRERYFHYLVTALAKRDVTVVEARPPAAYLGVIHTSCAVAIFRMTLPPMSACQR